MDSVRDLREVFRDRFGDAFRIEDVDPARRGVCLDISVPATDIEEAVSLLDARGFALEAITAIDWPAEEAMELDHDAVDWPAEEAMELVYDFNKMKNGGRVALRVRVPRATPELPSISKIYGGADWYEREAHEMFGIVFSGHPNLVPLILPEDADFHPLRKDYAP